MTSPAGTEPLPDEHLAHNLAQLMSSAQPERAEQLCNTILQNDPRHFDALYCLGIIYFQRGSFELSIAMLTRALELKQNSDIYSNLGLALAKLHLHQQAIECYSAAIALDAGNVVAYYNCGNSLLELGMFDEALKNYDQALAINPLFAEALSNRGNVLRLQKSLTAALTSYDAAIAIAPQNPVMLNNRGVVMMELNRPQEALNDYNRALGLYPDYVEALYNKGNALLALGRLAAAKNCLDQAVTIAPDNADAHLNRALLLLLTGDFAEGWPEYEWRSKQRSFVALHQFSQPFVDRQGKSRGKTILLYAEQGLGDTIQFVRYVSMVKALGASIILEVQAPLKSLMSDMDEVDAVIAQGEALPAFDYHCMLMSLPCAFNSTLHTIPSAPSYMKAPNDRIADWKNRLQQIARPRIGVSWSGNPGHKNDHNRSIPLQWLLAGLHPSLPISACSRSYGTPIKLRLLLRAIFQLLPINCRIFPTWLV